MSSIAERLREFRAAVGLTQREVAALCGLGKRTVIYWEMGERELKCSKLIPLVREYDLDFNWLIMGTGSMFTPTNSVASPSVLPQSEALDEPPLAPKTTSVNWGAEPVRKKPEQEDVLPLIERLRRR